MSETGDALRRLRRNVRILLCEELMQLGWRLRPADYTPALIQIVIEVGIDRREKAVEAVFDELSIQLKQQGLKIVRSCE